MRHSPGVHGTKKIRFWGPGMGVRSGNCLFRPGIQLPTMHAHELMKEVLKQTSAKQLAADLGVSLSLVYRWTEVPTGEGGSTNSPLERVGQLVRSSGDERIAQWVCEPARPRNLIPVTNDIVREFADMLATIAQSSADNVITAEEARRIRARWEQLKSVTEGFVQAAEHGGFRTEDPEPTS